MYKRGIGGEIVMFGPFFALLLIVFAGIYLGVNAYFSHSYESRFIEAGILGHKVEDCFSRHDFFAPTFNITASCELSADILSKEHLVYINGTDGRSFSLGVTDYSVQCYLNGAQSNEAYPKCFTKELTKDGRHYTLIVGSNQQSSRGTA